MVTTQRQRAWEDVRNWSFYGTFYHAPQDDRVLVPKQRKYLGWTFNFAHAESYLLLGALAGGIAAATYRFKK